MRGIDSRKAFASNVVTYRTFEYFFVAACLYYIISKAFTLSARIVAWRLFRY
jgi:ABC-type amino acid transport system permease subunit